MVVSQHSSREIAKDLTAALFLIGGAISLILSLLALPAPGADWVGAYLALSRGYAIALALSFACSLAALGCAWGVMERIAETAGVIGTASGVMLLILSAGAIEGIYAVNAGIGGAASVLIIASGVACIVLRT